MKKTSLLCMVAAILLIITQGCSVAQKEIITSKTASESKGYTVMNSDETIVMYKYVHKLHSPKEAEKYGPEYFFTTKSSDVLEQLTKDNLKKAFSTNHAFHDALDANFSQDIELINYDNFHKMYKVNWILKNNMQ